MELSWLDLSGRQCLLPLRVTGAKRAKAVTSTSSNLFALMRDTYSRASRRDGFKHEAGAEQGLVSFQQVAQAPLGDWAQSSCPAI